MRKILGFLFLLLCAPVFAQNIYPFSATASSTSVSAPNGSSSAAVVLPGNTFTGNTVQVFNSGAVTIAVAFSDSTNAAATAVSLPVGAGQTLFYSISPLTDTVAAYGIGGTGTVYFTRGNGGALQQITVNTGGGGSMTWPGAAGVPCYSGSSSWCTSYSATNQIPPSYLLPSLVSGSYLTNNGASLSWGTPSGTVPSCTINQLTYYAATGTTLTCLSLGSGLGISSNTLGISEPVNPQTGTTYTVLSTDCGKQITLNNAAAIAVALPQATGSFASCQIDFTDIGAGSATITPTTSTINGAANLAVAQNRQCTVNSDGTNWQVVGCTALVSGGSGIPNQIVGLSGGFNTPSGTQYIGWLAGGLGGGGGKQVAPRAGTISNLYVTGPAEGAAATLQITLQDNSVNQAVTCTIPSSGSSCNDLTHTFSFAAGDALQWQTVQTGTGTAGTVAISFLVQ